MPAASVATKRLGELARDLGFTSQPSLLAFPVQGFDPPSAQGCDCPRTDQARVRRVEIKSYCCVGCSFRFACWHFATSRSCPAGYHQPELPQSGHLFTSIPCAIDYYFRQRVVLLLVLRTVFSLPKRLQLGRYLATHAFVTLFCSYWGVEDGLEP